MKLVIIKDGKVLESFKTERAYVVSPFVIPEGAYIRWPDGRWSLAGITGNMPETNIPNEVRAIALLED